LAQLAAAGDAMIAQLLENGPIAIAETKACVLENAWGGFDRKTFDALVKSHAAKRRSEEGAEGLASFAEKRPAKWAPQA
jgi:methylglutaconyl-CoA hydratase